MKILKKIKKYKKTELDLTKISSNGLNHLLLNLELDDIAFIYYNQSVFYRKRIEMFLDSKELKKINKIYTEKSEKEINNLLKKINRLLVFENDKINNSFNLENIIVYLKIKYYKYLSRKINSSTKKLNIKRLKKILIFMSYISRKFGLIELDFLFLREDGLKEELFKFLLLLIIIGGDINIIIKNKFSENENIDIYKKILFIGLNGIISFLTPDEMKDILLDIKI
jgi:hypothetical protein